MSSVTNVYVCDICDQIFLTKDSRNCHMMIEHQVPVRYDCSTCGKSLANKKSLKVHMNTHNQSLKKFKCFTCNKLFNCNRDLTRHTNSMHRANAVIRRHKCSECPQEFQCATHLKNHFKIHLKCNECSKVFRSLFLLKKHKVLHNAPHQCPVCDRKFLYSHLYLKHLKVHKKNIRKELKEIDKNDKKKKRQDAPPSPRAAKCFNCDRVFPNRWLLNKHLKTECNHLSIPNLEFLFDDRRFHIEVNEALQGCMTEYRFTSKDNINSEKLLLDWVEPNIVLALTHLNNENIPVKWGYKMEVIFSRLNPDGEFEYKTALFASKEHAFNNLDQELIDTQIAEIHDDIVQRIDKYSKEGSKWVLSHISSFTLQFFRVLLDKGGDKVNLPTKLSSKKCVINLDTNHCFKWAVLAALHFIDVDHPERVQSYAQWENDFVWPEAPIVTAQDVVQFGKNNKLAVYTHFYSKKGLIECTYRPPRNVALTCPRIHLLLYADHWMTITNLSALYRESKGSFTMCDCCLASFYNRERFMSHLPCTPTNYMQREIMPKDPILKFKDYNKCVDLADIVYADLEAILEKCNDPGKVQKHIPCCAGAYWVSKVEDSKYMEFKGKDCMTDFCDYIEQVAKHIHERNKTATRKPAEKTQQELMRHEAATNCMWCKSNFVAGDKLLQKVFDHDHLTGKYRGPACQGCNNKLRQDRNSLVIAFHNFRGYDSHALCLEGLSSKPDWDLRPIAQNPEKYMSMSAYLHVDGRGNSKERFRIKFIDTLQLVNSSLATLASNLCKGSDYTLLKHAMLMRVQYPNVSESDIAGKGIFPYSYVDSWQKLDEPHLPPFNDFYDELEETVNITNDDYTRAQAMFTAFNCHTLFDYQLRYLELDCRLLADVFEEFRRLTKVEDGLDAAHFITVSQLSYASALKKCDTKIGLITDPEIFRDVERCKRGGYAFVNKHMCKANNPYVNPDQNTHTKDDVYLGDVDANNLYGNALRYPLPVGNFKYVEENVHSSINWNTVTLDGPIGYFVVCDLKYPYSIHDRTQNLPLAPEVLQITSDMLPDYFKQVNTRKNLSRQPFDSNPEHYRASTKLLATCADKKEYVVHFAVLQTYLKHGLIISKVHRVIQFNQLPIFKDYIDYNTRRRQEARNEFQKDFYKQKNCSLFGKSLENKRNRCDIKLCNSASKFVKAASDHKFKAARIFKDTLVAAELSKVNVELDSPIAIGAAVLDISKMIMYKLAYEEFPKYEALYNCKINIVGGDTDSFFLEVVGVDMIGTLFPKMLKDGLLDTSNYSKNHQMYSEIYKAKLGCIKDEFCGKPFTEFVLLRPKSYSMKALELPGDDKRKSKGVARRKIKLFTHDDYKRVFLTEIETSTHVRRMQSIMHTVYNVDQVKIALSHADDKRAWLSNNFSLPYGHFRIAQYINDPPPCEFTDIIPSRSVAELYSEIFPPAAKRPRIM